MAENQRKTPSRSRSETQSEKAEPAPRQRPRESEGTPPEPPPDEASGRFAERYYYPGYSYPPPVINVDCCGCHEVEEPQPEPPAEEETCCCSCVFEIRLQRWRFRSGKAGDGDKNAELKFVSHVDGNTHHYPSPNGSFAFLGKRGGKYWPGWQAANARVAVVEVPCKGVRQVDLMTEMIEGASFQIAGAQLEGETPWGLSEPAVMTLSCDSKPQPVVATVKLESNGNKSEDLEVQVEYRASRVTACGCG